MKAGAEAVRELRVAREKRGLNLKKVQVDTRIPVAHLEALEEGRFDDLPKGPFREGYWKAYRAYLELDSSLPLPILGLSPTPVPERRTQAPTASASGPQFSEPPLPRTPKPALVPLGVVRVIGIVSAVSLGVAMLWRMQTDGWFRADAPVVEAASEARTPDQLISIRAVRNTRLRVVVDGEVLLDRAVAGNELIEAAGHDEVEVGIAAAEQVKVVYNGQPMLLPGPQDEPRVLRFIDDRGATP
jgi:hypothetical protein